ncbi:MAG: sugar transporter periplasmic protein [Lachnospiraceae bacterium]|nr:sugar transporter periplasmic protein [Lachnospiraceae bacterium]
MKRKVLACCMAAFMVLGFTACGSTEKDSAKVENSSVKTESGNTEGGEDKGEAKKIVWATWSSQEDSTKDVISKMAEGFNGSGTTQVEVIGWPWADTQQQLIIRNQGSEVLDVAQVDINMFGALSEMDILVDMNELLGEDYLKENYEAAALTVGQKDGKQLGMPWAIASINMVYNPTLLAAVGYNEAPKTIAEFEDCMQKLREYDPEIIPYGVSTKDATMATDFQPWLWTFGGQLINEAGDIAANSDAMVQCMDWYKGLVDKGFIQMNIARSDARTLFAQGKMAFYDDAIASNGVAVSNGVDADNLDQYIKTMARPVLKEGDQQQVSMWGHLLVVFKKSKAQVEAGEFIKYLVSEDVGLDYLGSNGMPPVLKSALESDEVKNNTWVQPWLELTKDGTRLEFAMKSNGGELNNIVVEELQAAMSGAKDSKKAAEDMQLRLESTYK